MVWKPLLDYPDHIALANLIGPLKICWLYSFGEPWLIVLSMKHGIVPRKYSLFSHKCCHLIMDTGWWAEAITWNFRSNDSRKNASSPVSSLLIWKFQDAQSVQSALLYRVWLLQDVYAIWFLWRKKKSLYLELMLTKQIKTSASSQLSGWIAWISTG